MRELVYYVAVSLDGRIAAPDGDYAAFPAEGDHMERIAREYPETLPAPVLAHLGITPACAHFDTVLMGWNTYAVGLPLGVDDPYPHLRQVVFSRSARDVPEGIRLVRDDALGAVRALKEEDGGGIWLCGGAKLAGVLRGEIDRLILKAYPVVLGDGLPLFEGGYDPAAFTLVDSVRCGSGVLFDEYVRAS